MDKRAFPHQPRWHGFCQSEQRRRKLALIVAAFLSAPTRANAKAFALQLGDALLQHRPWKDVVKMGSASAM